MNEIFDKILQNHPAAIHKLNELLPEELSAIVRTAMAKAPVDRYQAMDELRVGRQRSVPGGGATEIELPEGYLELHAVVRCLADEHTETDALVGELQWVAELSAASLEEFSQGGLRRMANRVDDIREVCSEVSGVARLGRRFRRVHAADISRGALPGDGVWHGFTVHSNHACPVGVSAERFLDPNPVESLARIRWEVRIEPETTMLGKLFSDTHQLRQISGAGILDGRQILGLLLEFVAVLQRQEDADLDGNEAACRRGLRRLVVAAASIPVEAPDPQLPALCLRPVPVGLGSGFPHLACQPEIRRTSNPS